MMNPGDQYGRWTVLCNVELPGYWLCECACGTVKEVRGAHMRSGASPSCGCFGRDKRRSENPLRKDRLYGIWQNMKNRCGNPNVGCFHRYGGRGIAVCQEWLHSFAAFKEWADGNGYAPDLQIDRIDNDGNYEPRNCRWATRLEQALNRNETLRLPDGRAGAVLARENGINSFAFAARVRLGWSVEEACTRPLRRFTHRRG